MDKNKTLAIILIVVIIGACVGVAYAASTYWSNQVTVTPEIPQAAYTLTLTANTSHPIVGEIIELSATITPTVSGTPVGGIRVYFYQNNITFANALTETNGIATCTTSPLTQATPYVYNASCTI